MINILQWISNPVEDCKRNEADKTEDQCSKIKILDFFYLNFVLTQPPIHFLRSWLFFSNRESAHTQKEPTELEIEFQSSKFQCS